MKELLVIMLACISSGTFAQDKKLLFQYKPLDKELARTFIDRYLKQRENEVFPVDLVSVKPKGPEVLILPLDNMPCLMPSVKELNMPVLKLKATGMIPMAR